MDINEKQWKSFKQQLKTKANNQNNKKQWTYTKNDKNNKIHKSNEKWQTKKTMKTSLNHDQTNKLFYKQTKTIQQQWTTNINETQW